MGPFAGLVRETTAVVRVLIPAEVGRGRAGSLAWVVFGVEVVDFRDHAHIVPTTPDTY